jgi:GTP 3',8-cyclase
VRRNVERLIQQLAGIDHLRDLTMTTNGALLASKARTLREAGLRRVTVSLDSLEDDVFKAMNDVGFPVVAGGHRRRGPGGVDARQSQHGCQARRQRSQRARRGRPLPGTGHVLRFIEYMDVGTTNGWRLEDVVPAAEIVRSIDAVWPLEPVEPNYRGEVARRYRYRDGAGEIGRHRLRDAAVLPRLHPRPALRRRPALYLPVRLAGPRPQVSAPQGRERRRDRGAPHHHLDKTDGPLLRAPHR